MGVDQRNRSNRPAGRRAYGLIGTFALLSLVLTACGTRLDNASIRTDAGNTGLVQSASGTTTTTGPASSSASTTTTAAPGTGLGATNPSGAASGGSSTGGPSSGGSAGKSTSATTSPGSTAGGPASGSPVVIGNIGTYSGIVGTLFAGVQQGLSVSVASLNAHGGLNGHPVKLISEDDSASSSNNQTEAQTMVQSDGAIGFVSQFTPVSSSGSQGYLSSNGIAVLGGDLYGPTWFTQANWFPEGTSLIPGIAGAVMTIASKINKTNLGILYCVESPICSNLGQYDSQHPLDNVKVVYTAPISLTQPSFTAQCIDAKNAGVNLLFTGGDPSLIARVAQNCASQGINIEIAEAAISVSTSQTTNAQLSGLVAPLEVFPWFQNNSPATEAFHQAFQTYLPSFPPNENAAEAWTSVQLLQLAGAKLPASNPTAAELMAGADGLGTTNINGLSGSTLTFQAGQPATGTNCFTFVEIVNGAWTAPNGFAPVCS